MFAHHPAWRRALLRTIMTCIWPFGAIWEAGQQLIRTPAADRPAHPRGWLSRAAHMLVLAWIDHVPLRN